MVVISFGGMTASIALKVSNAKKGQCVVLLDLGGGLSFLGLQFARLRSLEAISVDGGTAKAESNR